MPEGPEIANITDVIRKKFLNSLLVKTTPSLRLHLPQKIITIGNKGKFIYITLEREMTIGITPSMTGHLVPSFPDPIFQTSEGYAYLSKHNRYTFVTNRGDFVFNDYRKFGKVYLLKKEQLEEKLDTLGPDLLRDLPKMSLSAFRERLLSYSPQKPLCDVLLDQSFIAGVGNYIRCDAMYLAKIYPLRTIGTLSVPETTRLKRALERVGRESYEEQKKQLHTYKFYIYQQPKAHRIRRFNRSIWYDPRVQKNRSFA